MIILIIFSNLLVMVLIKYISYAFKGCIQCGQIAGLGRNLGCECMKRGGNSLLCGQSKSLMMMKQLMGGQLSKHAQCCGEF